MKKYVLFLLALSFAGKAQNTLVFKNSRKMAALVLLIEQDSIRYKPLTNISGPDLYFASTDVRLVRYKNGPIVNVDSLYKALGTSRHTIAGAPVDMFKKGGQDAGSYFTRNCGSYALAGAGVAFAALALIPAFIVMAIPPKKSNLNYPSGELWQNEDYRAGYKDMVLRIKRKKIWKISIPTIVVSSIIWAKVAGGLR